MQTLYKLRFIPLVVGFVICIVGFYYSVIKAGIPYQDPTPEMTKKYMLYMRIGDTLSITGSGILLIAITLLIVLKIVNSKRKSNDNSL